MMRSLTRVILGISLMSLVACANLQTISRRTTLPSSADGAVAIHLDAQQRLVVVNRLGQYCAEPSPDALAAYASSLGLGVSAPSQGAASFAQALQSSAGSIGLRTQSITLMRDALYRLCEAYANGVIEPVQVATLMGRNQDLTAVILAIEQLTGAVAANQVILTGTAGAGASASLLANQQLLDAARNDEEAKTNSLNEAKKARDIAKKTQDDKRVEVASAEDAYKQATAANSTVAEDERIKLKTDLETKKQDLKQLESNLAAANGQVKTKEALLAEATRVRETIEKVKETALTNAVANTTSGGQFSIPVQRNELSKEATDSIATAVKGMVQQVLDKDYMQDTCIAFITNLPKDIEKWANEKKASYQRVQELCATLIATGVTKAITRIEANIGADETSERIQKALRVDPKLEGHLREWLAKKSVGISITLLLYGREFAVVRRQAIQELSIP